MTTPLPNPVQELVEAYHRSRANLSPCTVRTVEKGTVTTEVVHLPRPVPFPLKDAAQDYINAHYYDLGLVRHLIMACIHAHLDEYRQYDGYHDDSVLMTLTNQWDSKGGTAFAGDILLSRLNYPNAPSFPGDIKTITSYSVRMGSHLGMPRDWITPA